MNIDMYDKVYTLLKAHLSDFFKDKYKTINVHQKIPNNVTKYPVVVLTERGNSHNSKSTMGEEKIDSLRYEVEIYTTDLPVNGQMVSSVTIGREIQREVDEIMGNKLKMERTSASPTPNLDTTIYRILMQYNTRININRNKLLF